MCRAFRALRQEKRVLGLAQRNFRLGTAQSAVENSLLHLLQRLLSLPHRPAGPGCDLIPGARLGLSDRENRSDQGLLVLRILKRLLRWRDSRLLAGRRDLLSRLGLLAKSLEAFLCQRDTRLGLGKTFHRPGLALARLRQFLEQMLFPLLHFLQVLLPIIMALLYYPASI